METFPNFDRQVEGFMRVTLPSFRKRPINMPTGRPHFFAADKTVRDIIKAQKLYIFVLTA